MYALITCVVLIIVYASSMFIDQKMLKIAKLFYCKVSQIAKLSHYKVLQATRSLYYKVLKYESKSHLYNFNFKNNFKKNDNFV